MTLPEEYLRLPVEGCTPLRGLRWSADGDAVETIPEDEGGPTQTVIVTAAIARFLEGFSPGDGLPSFIHILQFLRWLGTSQPFVALDSRAERLSSAFHAAGRLMRNAGALCAALCEDLPRAADAPEPAEVVELLARRQWRQTQRRPSPFAIYDLAEFPPLSPQYFERQVLARVEALSDDALRHWLKHGREPAEDVGRKVAQLLPPPLLATLAGLECRPRLAGVGSLIANLAGALSLPPRRRAQSELPSGGYSDVATRGLPEQILPTQFALDDMEFLRRFAEHELLYFHREEPHQPTTEEVVLLVDQGVRTWGDVRLVLVAAALALGRQAARRGLSLLVSATSMQGRVLAVEQMGHEALGAVLETSDLSPHPAAELACVLDALESGPRDIVLLTHSFSLKEPAVAAAARRVPDGARLFGVTVDASGEVALAELREGSALVLARCRVEVRPDAPTRNPRPVPPVTLAPGVWRGDVEPIGYPFSLGAFQRFSDDRFTFDAKGESVLLAGPQGLLHWWKADGSRGEMLPRAMIDDAPLHQVEAVIGVAGGFAVAGTNGKALIVAHYDLARRTVTTYVFDIRQAPIRNWSYDRRHHVVVGRRSSDPSIVCAVDLSAPRDAACYRSWTYGEPAAPRAWRAARAESETEPRPLLLRSTDTLPDEGRLVCLNSQSGVLSLRDQTGRWVDYYRRDDGQAVLRDASMVNALWHSQTLAVLFDFPNRKIREIHLLETNQGRPLARCVLGRTVEAFALSLDGRRFAFRVNKRQLVIHEVGRVSPLFFTPLSKAHSRIEVELGPSVLLIDTGKYTHLIRWDRGPLRFVLSHQSGRRLLEEQFAGSVPKTFRAIHQNYPAILGPQFDTKRFVSCTLSSGLGVLVDIAGHVVLLDFARTIICIFHVYRSQVAVWMPDGTRLGPVSVIGGPPTRYGADRIAQTLRAAEQRFTEATP